MKTISRLYSYIFQNLATILILTLFGCHQNQDKQIKADLNSQARDNLNFAGIRYTVHEGTVSVFGTCPSEKAKGKVLETIKGIHIIKGIDDRIVIATVSFGQEQEIKDAVDSILVNYPLATAQINDQKIILSGSIKREELNDLINGMKAFGKPIEQTALKIQ